MRSSWVTTTNGAMVTTTCVFTNSTIFLPVSPSSDGGLVENHQVGVLTNARAIATRCLLAAAQACRPELRARGQAHHFEHFRRLGERVRPRAPLDHERDGTSRPREVRKQVKVLEDEANLGQANSVSAFSFMAQMSAPRR